MAHLQVWGRSLSGKSSLVKAICRSSSYNVPALIYDPIAPRPGVDIGDWRGVVCTDWLDFHDRFWRSTGCIAVVDEAGSVCADYDQRLQLRAMLQRGRHPPTCHAAILISQRYTDVDKTAREQCTSLRCFRVSDTDAKALAAEWGDALLGASNLPPGQFFAADGCGPVRLCKLF